MATLREIKQEARAGLHEAMKVTCLYLLKNPAYGDPGEPMYLETTVNVRVHDKFAALGDMKGTNFHYAEATESQPRIVFLVSELASPARGAIVSVAAGEAYRLDNVDPVDGITITANALRLKAADTVGLPLYVEP